MVCFLFTPLISRTKGHLKNQGHVYVCITDLLTAASIITITALCKSLEPPFISLDFTTEEPFQSCSPLGWLIRFCCHPVSCATATPCS